VAFASLRSAPGRPLTASFPSKIRHLSGGRVRSMTTQSALMPGQGLPDKVPPSRSQVGSSAAGGGHGLESATPVQVFAAGSSVLLMRSAPGFLNLRDDEVVELSLDGLIYRSACHHPKANGAGH
jgi:hypothetical protein